MEFFGDYVVYNADDEEPKCIFCNNQDIEYFCKHCGAEYGWRYYKREERED